MPLPAAKKKTQLMVLMLCGKVKNPAAPVVISSSPGLARSTSVREKTPLAIRFIPMESGSFNTGVEIME